MNSTKEKGLYRKAREEFWSHHPRVTRLKRPASCDGIKYGSVALKDLYPHGPRGNKQPARGIQDKSRCKNPAKWRFKALKNSYAKDGKYCTIHLYSSCLYLDTDEWKATNKWRKANRALWESICEKLGISPGSKAEEVD